MRRLLSSITIAVAAFAAVAALASGGRVEAEPSTLPRRVAVPMLAFDPVPNDPLPAADPGYCVPAGGPSSGPPSSVFGFLDIGGVAAPAGTIVQVMFDGRLGPATRSAVNSAGRGGYRIDYNSGGADCINHAGAAIGVLVAGQTVDTGVKVGDPTAIPALIFNVTIP